jgi:hypothetical protein
MFAARVRVNQKVLPAIPGSLKRDAYMLDLLRIDDGSLQYISDNSNMLFGGVQVDIRDLVMEIDGITSGAMESVIREGKADKPNPIKKNLHFSL